MRVVEDVTSCEEAFDHVVVAVGSFDGVHRGHEAVLGAVVREAEANAGTPAVLTMRPHPREFFSPTHAPNLLTNESKKLELFASLGIRVAFILPFNEQTASLGAREFVERIIRRRCGAKAMIVGHDFQFGKGGEGDYELLGAIGPELGVGVSQVPAVMVGGERVSSTLIRECVLEGDLDKAEELLGRRYSLVGEIVSGRGVGAHLGFPTANIKPGHSAIPPHGVYAAKVIIDEVPRVAAVNIGIAPTIRQEDITVEAFVLGFSGDILGRQTEIVFHKRLRPERKFPSRDELIAQIDRDVAEVRAFFD